MTSSRVAVLLLLAFLLPPSLGHAKDTRKVLRVATMVAPPFSMKAPDGRWEGISIRLWDDIARRLGLSFVYQETDLQGLLDGMAGGAFDVAATGLTLTQEREKLFDFSNSYYSSGLGIAVAAKQADPWLNASKGFVSKTLLKFVAFLVLLLLVVGALVWLIERRKNPEHFGGEAHRGIGAGIWWSAVTMTSVGYGDKTPRTLAGRVVAVVWMFVGLVIVSVFTAIFTSQMTLIHIQGRITSPQDLYRVRVGVAAGTAGAAYLTQERITALMFPEPGAGLQALAGGGVEAFVHDEPILKFLINRDYPGVLKVLPMTFQRQEYAIALKNGSPLREAVNQALLAVIAGPDWRKALHDYFGPVG